MSTIPLRRRLLYTLVVFGVVAVLAEGLLAAYPRISHALRDRAVAPEAIAIACLGDSVTYGDGLQPGEAWPEQLGGSLSARGLPISVHNLGAQGQTGHAMKRRARTFVDTLPAESVPVVLVMLGHNDFVYWPITRQDGSNAFSGTEYDPTPDGERQWEPRLFRVGRWVAGALSAEVPVVNLSDRKQVAFTNNLTALRQRVEDRGGRVYVMTYALPGSPPDDMPDHRRSVIAATRSGQAEINAALREIAGTVGVDVLDIESALPMQDPWTAAEMLDHIHLTALSSTALADEVRRLLVADGLLPPEAL